MTESATLPRLPEGYIARPAVMEDGQALADLLAACDIDIKGSSDMTLIDFLGDWAGTDLETDTLVITNATGDPVAYADTHHRGFTVFYVYGYVLPSARGQGLGSYLLRWGEGRARDQMSEAPANARVVIRHYVNDAASAAAALFRANDYAPVRLTYVMTTTLTEDPPEPVWPEGFAVRTFVPGADDVATWEAHEAAFADIWQRPAGTLESFRALKERPYFDPALWFLGMDAEQIVATVLANDIDGKGWIEGVGVRRPWRGRGIALAMLQHAFRQFWSRGVHTIGLSVDAESPTGATRLYARAGMTVEETYVIYEHELRSGEMVTPVEDE